MIIQWEKKALKDFKRWKKENRKVSDKIILLIKSIKNDGLISGIGKPEALINRKECSRRINDWDRLIYRVNENVLTILSCKDHQGYNYKRGKYI